MYRIFGIIIFSISAGLYSTKKLYNQYLTIQFLSETTDIMNYLILNSGGIYTQIFKKIELSKYKIYKNFDFENKNSLINLLKSQSSISKQYISELSYFLNELGQKSAVKENAFILKKLTLFDYYLKTEQENFINSRKMYITLSISLTAFIIIIAI